MAWYKKKKCTRQDVKSGSDVGGNKNLKNKLKINY